MKNFKRFIPDLIILVIFIIASIMYFKPALEGKIVFASDNLQAIAANHQAKEHLQKTGESVWWLDAMFSGMPSYQAGGGKYLITKVLSPIVNLSRYGENNAIFFLLFYLVAFYFLLRSFEIKKWMSMAGAFAMALSSYFLIVIAATHYGKPVSICNMSLVLAGFVITYRGKYAWGGFFTAFFTMLGFFRHPQMSYYMCLLIGVCWFAELAIAIMDSKKKSPREVWKHFGIATAVFIGSFGLGLATQAADFLANREYQAETMRGGHSDIAKDETVEGQKYKADKGLSLKYATDWSYGIDETMTFLIPNYEGGASGYKFDKESDYYKALQTNCVPAWEKKAYEEAYEIYSKEYNPRTADAGAREYASKVSEQKLNHYTEHAPTYRGEKAFTAGPVYMGAIICFLFLLALIVAKGPYKWALLVATLFSVLLAWGRHFMPMTEFFFRFFPMYNKFRAVESILIVAEITMPLLAFLGIKAIGDKERNWKFTQIAIGIAGGVTALICMIVAIRANSIDVISTYDTWGKNEPELYQTILQQRAAMIKASAWRSFWFVLVGTALAYGYAYFTYNQKNRKGFLYEKTDVCFGILFAAFIVIDMWAVDKKFCNDDNFKDPTERDEFFEMQSWEKEVLKDKSYFRVLNLTTNVFNDARSSYYVNSIGGYSAVKLRRYQDIIDEHIGKEINPLYSAIIETGGFQIPDAKAGADFPVLNMLNMKYTVLPGKDNTQIVVQNPYAMGAVWFTDNIYTAQTPKDECAALDSVDLHTTAVIGKDMASYVAKVQPSTEPAKIELVSQDPIRKKYHAVTPTDKVAVFSEVYYPKGWKAYIDGKPAEHFRANYLLRAMVIPAGEHDILFVCEPESVRKGNIISMISLGLMLCLLALAIWGSVRTIKKTKE